MKTMSVFGVKYNILTFAKGADKPDAQGITRGEQQTGTGPDIEVNVVANTQEEAIAMVVGVQPSEPKTASRRKFLVVSVKNVLHQVMVAGDETAADVPNSIGEHRKVQKSINFADRRKNPFTYPK